MNSETYTMRERMMRLRETLRHDHLRGENLAAARDALTREFTADASFQMLCTRVPTLRHDHLRGEKRARMMRLRELYAAATGNLASS